MRAFFSRRASLGVMVTLTVVACMALATPWAQPFRRAIRPGLPLFVIVLAAVSAVGQLVVGAVQLVSKPVSASERWRAAALPLSLGASALCMVLAFLPHPQRSLLHLFPLLGAALFAVAAAALQRRARARSDS
ncbi:MAG: hypothetical protein ABI446_14975 [Gemmatimonadaceae bacterium]